MHESSRVESNSAAVVQSRPIQTNHIPSRRINTMANSTPARKKRKASEATTAAAAAAASRDADASQQTPMSKAEKRAEAMRRAQEYRDRLKAKKQAGSGSGDAGDAAGSSGSSSSSRPSPKKKKAAAGGKAGKKSSTGAKGKAGAKGKGKAKRSPARKSTAAASAASAATPTRATRSAGVVETPDTVPRPMPTSTGKGKSQGKRGGGRSAATGTRAAEDASSSDEDEEEDEMDVEEDVDEDKKDEDGEEASFSSDDERTARARNHGTPRKRRKVGRSPPKTKTEANGVRGDGDDGGSDAAAKRKGEAAAERKARKAEEERRAREWRERKYHSPPSSTGAGAANGGGAADATTCRAPVARTTVEARSPPRQRSAAPPRVAASAATARTSPVAPRPTTSRPRPRPVVQNGHGRTSAPRAPAATPDSIQAQRREQQPLEHLPQDENEVGEDRSVLSKYPYLVILLVVCAPLGIGMFLGSSGLARPALKDFTDELGGMLAETKRNLLPGQQANSQLIRCLADSPDVPAVEHTGADEEGDDATGRTTFSANTGSGDDSPWWTKTPPALISKTATAATSKTCAGSANPLPCPRHGRCAHGFLVDCRADDAIAGRSNLFAVSEESFSDCVLSTEAKQIVSAIQGKVIDLSIEQKCNVSCRWGVGVPFISSTMTPKERCGGVDPDDVMAVRSKDDTVDYFFSVDGLVGAMDYDVTSDADSPSAGVPAISSEIVQLLAPHLDEGIIKYIPGSSAILTPRIGLTIDFVSNKLDEYLPFSCWFPAKVWECVLFLLGLVVVVFSWIFRFIRTNPGHAFYIFLTIVAAQHIYL